MKTMNVIKAVVLPIILLTSIAACTKNEIIEQPFQNEIGFSSYIGNVPVTRASVVNNVNNGFGVFASYTEGSDFSESSSINFMFNQKVTSTDGSNWTYSPVKYWPTTKDSKLSFFAYAPYGNNNITLPTNYSEGTPVIDFTVNSTIKSQVDFLLAESQKNKVKENGKINFQFKHALSRIGFGVAYKEGKNSVGAETNVLADGTTIKINSVTLSESFYKSGSVNMDGNNYAWVKSNDKIGFTLDNNNFTSAVKNGVTGIVQDLNDADSYLMVIPQNFSGENAGFEVEVNYTITTVDSALNGGKVEYTNKAKATISKNLEAGKAYKINIVIGMDAVEFSAGVTDWDETHREYVYDADVVAANVQ